MANHAQGKPAQKLDAKEVPRVKKLIGTKKQFGFKAKLARDYLRVFINNDPTPVVVYKLPANAKGACGVYAERDNSKKFKLNLEKFAIAGE